MEWHKYLVWLPLQLGGASESLPQPLDENMLESTEPNGPPVSKWSLEPHLSDTSTLKANSPTTVCPSQAAEASKDTVILEAALSRENTPPYVPPALDIAALLGEGDREANSALRGKKGAVARTRHGGGKGGSTTHWLVWKNAAFARLSFSRRCKRLRDKCWVRVWISRRIAAFAMPSSWTAVARSYSAASWSGSECLASAMDVGKGQRVCARGLRAVGDGRTRSLLL